MIEAEFREWIWTTFSDSENHGLFTLSRFFSPQLLYRTGIIGPLLATIVNGRCTRANFNAQSYPAEYEYDALIRHLCSVTRNEQAWCFYFLEHDNASGELAKVWKWNPLCASNQLELFERQPAEEAGAAHLGIVAESRTWMLLHNYQPYQYFEIVFCSSENVTQDLLRSLKLQVMEDMR